ncbi:MAG: pdxa: 4-hydroxythreonine-4-phosphate dehydrogenase pdxa [Verrucomicrobiales bacterium]|nr:pdxa: 4-hydroxythreonine-4-phosphate dehydrogenase pdxa [Verrucomicrobiales bacterium]
MIPRPPVIGITLGDAAGIGPEVTRGALAGGKLDPRFEYRVIGRCPQAVPGQPDAVTARAALDSLEESVRLLKTGELAAVVTAPVSKDLLAAHGFEFPGQTEFYAARFGVSDFQMCLTGPHLTVGLVTIHEPLSRVPGLLTTAEIVRHGRLLADFCRRRGRKNPRIAVAGLNPHAGENGRMGTEEQTTILPAVAELNAAEAEPVFHGPLPPDTLFYKAARGAYDAVLCMYHDQGLIPLKLLDFDEAVNLTLGLPVIRTSPDHGTAFDIAGRNMASPASMTAALRLAAELAAHGISGGESGFDADLPGQGIENAS